MRTYTELSRLETFTERFQYLKLQGLLGDVTFGFDRWINQQFYKSQEWQQVRTFVIVRDNGCDLGVPGYEIGAALMVHHMNPLRPSDLIHGSESIIDPEFLILTSLATHNAIHYGDNSLLPRGPVVRVPGDTTLW
jgi:hypothetical protein